MTSRRGKSTHVQVTRHDLAPLVRGLAQNIMNNADANTRRIEEQERLWKYEQTECLWYAARQYSERPPRYYAKVIAGLPPGVEALTAVGARPESLAVDLRFRYAHALMARKLVRDWDDARARAAKAKFLYQAGV